MKLDKESDTVSRSLLSNSPDIVVSTPARAWHNVKLGALSLKSVRNLVLDEADLLLSYGYREDLESLAQSMPKGVQTILTTATMNDVQLVESLFLRDPVQLDLHEPEAENALITQYVVRCGEDDKFLFAYLIFKLKLIKGKWYAC
jgi:ATP-dependent RNA helicase DDX56/DBP9